MGLATTIKNSLLGVLMSDHFVDHHRRSKRTLALTFDDGPDPIYTPMVLDILRAQGVSATFFMIGERAERHPEIVKRIVSEGHEIGNHAYRHIKFATLPLQSQLAEIAQTDRLLSRYDGRQWHWFRPPQGKLTFRLLLALLKKRHGIAMWSYDSLDYKKQGVGSIWSRFAKTPVRGGDVVLFHDDNDVTVAALQQLITKWRTEGYGFDLLQPP